MASIANAEFQTNTGITDATGLVGPRFAVGDYVYILSEYEQTAGQNANFQYNPYQVVENTEFIKEIGGTNNYVQLDQTAAASATAEGAADVPWHYALKRVKDGGILRGVHDSLLATLATVKTTIGTEANDWTDPS